MVRPSSWSVRLSIRVTEFDMQFDHFPVGDKERLLSHGGFKAIFPALREAVARLIDPATLRHIAWSHFESDEAGRLNQWVETERLPPTALNR